MQLVLCFIACGPSTSEYMHGTGYRTQRKPPSGNTHSGIKTVERQSDSVEWPHIPYTILPAEIENVSYVLCTLGTPMVIMRCD